MLERIIGEGTALGFAWDMISMCWENPIAGACVIGMVGVTIYMNGRADKDRHALNKDAETRPSWIERRRIARENPMPELDWDSEIDPLDFQAQAAARRQASFDKVNAEMFQDEKTEGRAALQARMRERNRK